MSLINKVINDLEDRQAFVGNKEGKIFHGLTSANNASVRKKFITINIFTVMLFLVGSVSGTYALMEKRAENVLEAISDRAQSDLENINARSSYKLLDVPLHTINKYKDLDTELEHIKAQLKTTSLKLDFSLPDNAVESSATAPEELVLLEKNLSNVNGMFIDESDKKTFLNLKLAAERNYRAYALRNPNRVVIEIDDAKYSGELPKAGIYENFSNFRLNENHRDRFIMAMDTGKPYSIQDMNMSSTGKGYLLRISMSDIKVSNSSENRQVVESSAQERERSLPSSTVYGEMTRNISSNNSSEKARVMYINAQEFYGRGKHEQGNGLLEKLLRDYSDHEGARTLLSQKLIAQGQLGRAEELLIVGLNTKIDNEVWADLYARLLVHKGDINTAIEVLVSVTPDISSNPDYFAFLAALYQKTERHSEAVNTYREVLRIKPSQSVWWMGLAISLESLLQNNDALYAYKKALQGNRMTQELKQYVHSKINYLSKRS